MSLTPHWEAVFASHPPERVIFGLDANILVRDESGLTGALPEYLYNTNPLDDVRYFLNRDTLNYSVYTLMTLGRGGGTPSMNSLPGTGISGGTI